MCLILLIKHIKMVLNIEACTRILKCTAFLNISYSSPKRQIMCSVFESSFLILSEIQGITGIAVYCLRLSQLPNTVVMCYNIIQCSLQAVLFMSRKWFCNLWFYIRLSWQYILQISKFCANRWSDHYTNNQNYYIPSSDDNHFKYFFIKDLF